MPRSPSDGEAIEPPQTRGILVRIGDSVSVARRFVASVSATAHARTSALGATACRLATTSRPLRARPGTRSPRQGLLRQQAPHLGEHGLERFDHVLDVLHRERVGMRAKLLSQGVEARAPLCPR